MPNSAAIARALGALILLALVAGCEDQAVLVQLERQTLASLCTTDCPSADEVANRGCGEARSLGLSPYGCATTLRCGEGPTVVSVGRTVGTNEPAEHWWFDADGHLIASRHCRLLGNVDACVHYGPDLTCTL